MTIQSNQEFLKITRTTTDQTVRAIEIKDEDQIKTVLFNNNKYQVYDGSLKDHIWVGYPAPGQLQFSIQNTFTKVTDLPSEQSSNIDKIAQHILQKEPSLAGLKIEEHQDIKECKLGAEPSATIHPIRLNNGSNILIKIKDGDISYQLIKYGSNKEDNLSLHQYGSRKGQLQVVCTIPNNFTVIPDELKKDVADIEQLALKIFNKIKDDEKKAKLDLLRIAKKLKPNRVVKFFQDNKTHFKIAILAMGVYLATYYSSLLILQKRQQNQGVWF
ncbi:MAG: hypothetical protein K1060chlam5_00242 [Candidatus Anoxychlamydiales bacterium]|nr:hypothetical protein [Candidatus Anoxychlamydiales bacterium]